MKQKELSFRFFILLLQPWAFLLPYNSWGFSDDCKTRIASIRESDADFFRRIMPFVLKESEQKGNTNLVDYGGTYGSEACLFGDQYGYCGNHGNFAHKESILRLIAEDLFVETGKMGYFERVSDQEDKDFGKLLGDSKQYYMRVRSRFASKNYAIEPTNKESERIMSISSPVQLATGGIILQSCKGRYQIEGERQMCFEQDDYYQTPNNNALKATDVLAEMQVFRSDYFYQYFPDYQEPVFSSNNTAPNLDQIVTVRYNQSININGKSTTLYVLGFQDNPHEQYHRDFNDLVVEIYVVDPEEKKTKSRKD